MTPTLLFAWRAIIQWVTFWVTPSEFVFDMIEMELHRRGVDPSRQKTTAGQRASSARPEHGCEALPRAATQN